MIFLRLALTFIFLAMGPLGALLASIYCTLSALVSAITLRASPSARETLAARTLIILSRSGSDMGGILEVSAKTLLSWVPLVVGAVLLDYWVLAVLGFIAMELSFRTTKMLYFDVYYVAKRVNEDEDYARTIAEK